MTTEPEQGQLDLQTPGQILKQAREEKQLSQEEIAKRLNLKIDIISSLEEDQYDRIAAPTYTKGYLRSYARVIGLEAQNLIELFDKIQGQDSNPEILPKVSKHRQVSSSDKPVKLITYLITLGLVLLLLIWWQGKLPLDTSDFTSAKESQKPEQKVQNNSAFDYEYTIVEHPKDPHYRAAPNSVDYSETPLIAVEKESIIDTTIAPEIANNGDLNEQAVTSEDINQDIAATDSELEITNTALINKNNLTLLVEKESWIEIYDANNNRLFLDLAEAGKVIRVSGPTPYSLLVGNAEGVRIQFEGEDYDLDPHTRSGVARLKLGE